MKPLIEFSVVDSGSTKHYAMEGNEVVIAAALYDYAMQFLPPRDDEGRIEGWLLAKTGIRHLLQSRSCQGVGYDVVVATSKHRSITMRRNYLYWKRDIEHIRQQWGHLWNSHSSYRDAYLSLIDLEHFTDHNCRTSSRPLSFGPQDRLVVNWNGNAVAFVGYDKEAHVFHNGTPFVNEQAITYL
jgi:hypothetical protein